MNRLFLITVFLFLSHSIVFSQSDEGWVTFENESWKDYLFIDTINYPNNIWQVGSPSKVYYNGGYSSAKAIVTDTLLPYPANDTSVFYVRNIINLWFWSVTTLSFFYKIDADEGTDFGKIEFSPDNGVTWIDYLTDTVYNDCYWANIQNFMFTGHQDVWQFFEIAYGPSNECLFTSDTVWYKFIFISDNIQTGKDGWIIDNLLFQDYSSGTDEIKNRRNVIVYPNPATSFITITIPGDLPIEEAIIYNHLGQKALEAKPVNNTVNVSKLKPGIYFIEVVTKDWRGWTKFIIKN